MLQRTIKTSPHLFLPEQYDISIYLDGNCKPAFDDCQELSEKYNISENYIICFEHPSSNNIKDDAQNILLYRFESETNINAMLEKQKNDNYKYDNGLTETNFLIRKHKNIIQFSTEWTECINICIRDQMSFDYLLDNQLF